MNIKIGTYTRAIPLIAFIILLWTIQPGRTVSHGDTSEDELASQVTIRRDEYGVPHILAPTEEAAAFGQGYVTAEDHILTLARLFLQARGEESLYFGERFAESDFLIKELHIWQVAKQGYEKSPPWVQVILDGYAAGYDRYIEKHRAELPEWVKPVTGIDVLAHSRHVTIMQFTMDLRQLGAIGKDKAAEIGHSSQDTEGTPGSNMWALGKGKTAGGEGILLGNPHLFWGGSQTFHEVQITVPGKVHVSGTTLIGNPGVAIGFNDNLGWSHTVNSHDSDDVYELTLDPQDQHRYIYDGRSIPMTKETITVDVKMDQGVATRSRDVYWSHYGPVLKWANGKAYAFKSADMNEYRFIEQWNLMDKAHSLAEFRDALDMQALPMFNICYADREGNVFYIFNGRFPERPAGYNWSGVVPGNTSATEWNHVLPESRLPQLLDPPGGYVQNSNSSPWYTNPHAVIDRHKYPDDLTPNFNSLRTQNSLEMLESHPTMTLDDVLHLKFTMKLMLADRVKPDLIRLARGKTVDGVSLDEAVTALDHWDNTASRDAKGAMLFITFWEKYIHDAHPVFAVEWSEEHPTSTPSGIGDTQLALKALAQAVTEMKQKYGSVEIPWGDIHRLRRGNLDVPIGGETDQFGAFRVIGYIKEDDGKYKAANGDSYVMAVDFTNPPKAYSIVAYSESDDPQSPHYNDQSRLFAQEKWKRAWFTEDDIKQHTERSYHP
jgi:acyl-homoserine-lactone acylase